MEARTLYKTPHGSESVLRAGRATLGHFVRGARDVAWRTENQIGEQAVVALGSRAVEIAQEGREKVVGHRGTAVFYNPGAHYRRSLVDPRGDDCRYIALETPMWEEILQDRDPGHTGKQIFRWARASVSAPLSLRFQHTLRRATRADALTLEESLVTLASLLVDAALPGLARAEDPPPAHHREAAHALEIVLSERFRQGDTLQQLASRVDLSPYHAARVFRRVTGQSLHGYRDRLRILASLPEIASGERLDVIARGLGYASHAHFSGRFRRMVGVPPRAARTEHDP